MKIWYCTNGRKKSNFYKIYQLLEIVKEMKSIPTGIFLLVHRRTWSAEWISHSFDLSRICVVGKWCFWLRKVETDSRFCRTTLRLLCPRFSKFQERYFVRFPSLSRSRETTTSTNKQRTSKLPRNRVKKKDIRRAGGLSWDKNMISKVGTFAIILERPERDWAIAFHYDIKDLGMLLRRNHNIFRIPSFERCRLKSIDKFWKPDRRYQTNETCATFFIQGKV